jgi:diguanylate cyclase (GGDEF)-like protein
MADLIHTVADLIEERDREDLEMTLARVMFELSEARSLGLWRTFRRKDGVWLRRRAALPAAEGVREDIALADAPAPLRLAYDTRNFVRWRDSPRSAAGCVFPVQGDAEVLALIVLETAGQIERDRVALLSGLLRVYRGHLAALDYGDVDELTRLANRRTFHEQFGRLALAEVGRKGGKQRFDDLPGARAHLGVADIDFFKQINDRFGHPYGDEVLVLLAGLMRQTFRDTDRLFRFGGEEFVILVSNCGIDEAVAAFERFRAAVEAFAFPQVGRVTVSLGVTSVKANETGSDAFGRADQALYVAKRRGRNRVLLYEALHGAGALEARPRVASEIELF